MGTRMNMRVRMRRGMGVGNEDEREWCREWKKLRKGEGLTRRVSN